MSRRAIGEGTIYQRKDGRWEGAAYLGTVSGKVRRLRVYGKTRKEAYDKLTIRMVDVQRGVPVADHIWTVGAYIDYYMADIAPKNLRPSTIEMYEGLIRKYIKPMIGTASLTQLSVTGLQKAMDSQVELGMTPSSAIKVKTVLMAVLTNAMYEDLVVRNVARLVRTIPIDPKPFRPWTSSEIGKFLESIKDQRLYAAFLMTALYGTRRGETLGLRWSDIDWERGVIRLRQQLIRVRKEARVGPLKTKRSKRDLPLLPLLRQALMQYSMITAASDVKPADDWDLVFRDNKGFPVDPAYFSESLFHRLSKRAGLRRSKVHGFRHSTATILKNLGIPDKDIQSILGHSRVSTTQEIYEHADVEAQAKGLSRLERVLQNERDSYVSRQTLPSNVIDDVVATSFRSVKCRSGGDGPTVIADSPLPSNINFPTPVIQRLHARLSIRFLGGLAVNVAVKTVGQNRADSDLPDRSLVGVR